MNLAIERTLIRIALVLGLVLSSACGPSITPIDLHDTVVPIESRRLVADAQDAVSIGRARRDEAVAQLKAVRAWEEEMLKKRKWPSNANGALGKLEKLAGARVLLAEMELERADVKLAFARAKYDLVTAKVAVRHDLAVYELEPLRERTETERKKLEKMSLRIEKQLDKVDKLNSSWWKTYSSFVKKGGKSQAFYVRAMPEPKIKSRKKKKKKKGKKGKKGKGDELDLKKKGGKKKKKTASK